MADQILLEDGSEEDIFPRDENKQRELLTKCLSALTSSEAWRQDYEVRWDRFYKLIHSFVTRVAGEWGSAVFIPMIYTTIETIIPRILAQQPTPVVKPVGPEDDAGAPSMEQMLRWSLEQSKCYLELLKASYYALYFGTGILKVMPVELSSTRKVPGVAPVMGPAAPMMDPETQMPMTDMNGTPMMGEPQPQMGPDGPMMQPSGKMTSEKVVYYIGPQAEAVNPKDLYPDPLCTGFDDAEYMIQRAWRSKTWVMAQLKSGYFRSPIEDGEFTSVVDSSMTQLLGQRGIGGSGSSQADRRCEIHECWYRDGTVVTIVNRKLIVRVVKNPYEHGQMPFVRVVNKLNPGEFWGSGEVEQLEGLQDLLNAIWNQRVDNVRLKMNPPILYDGEGISDLREFVWGPGAMLKVNNRNGLALQEVVSPLTLGDVTSSAYEEANAVIDMIERVSAVSGYATGTDAESLNDTATGVAIISEQGNTRFAFKVKVAELTGYQELFRQYGALLQQFMPDDFKMRIDGPDGVSFAPVEPAALYGAFDYQVEPQSTTQTETAERQQALERFQLALGSYDQQTGQPVFNLQEMAKDLLRADGKKDLQRLLSTPPPQVPGPSPMGEPAPMGAPMNGGQGGY